MLIFAEMSNIFASRPANKAAFPQREGRLFGLFGDGDGQYDLGVGFPAFGDGGDAGLLDFLQGRQLFLISLRHQKRTIHF